MDRTAASVLLGLNCAKLRAERGWSPSLLAAKLGWATSQIEALEAGKTDLTLDDIDLLSKCFAVTPYALLQECPSETDFREHRRSA